MTWVAAVPYVGSTSVLRQSSVTFVAHLSTSPTGASPLKAAAPSRSFDQTFLLIITLLCIRLYYEHHVLQHQQYAPHHLRSLIMERANISPDYTGNRSTMERIAAHIPGTTEYEVFLTCQIDLDSPNSRHAERQHPNLTRQGRGHLNTAQATAGVPPNVNPNVNQAVPVPATQQQFAAPTTAHQPALHQGPANSGLGPTTGQKVSVSDIIPFVYATSVHQCLCRARPRLEWVA